MISILTENLYHFMVSGVLQANITQDGGLECHQEIPFIHHIMFVVILSAIHILFIVKWKDHLKYQVKQQNPSLFEKIFALLSLVSYIWTFYYKIITRKGLFILNPCHMAILIQIYLLVSKNNQKNRIIHTAWTGWLFGPYMATFIPHLSGLNNFQIFLYFYEHIALIPLGFLVLAKRYSFVKPTLRNHLAAFSTIALYQFLILVPFSRSTMVNLNFALCHSHADPSFPVIGYYYFVSCTLFLNIFSYIARWTSYFMIKSTFYLLKFIGINEAEIIQITDKNKTSSQSISTKDQ